MSSISSFFSSFLSTAHADSQEETPVEEVAAEEAEEAEPEDVGLRLLQRAHY